jgi:hypothetical protein
LFDKLKAASQLIFVVPAGGFFQTATSGCLKESASEEWEMAKRLNELVMFKFM